MRLPSIKQEIEFYLPSVLFFILVLSSAFISSHSFAALDGSDWNLSDQLGDAAKIAGDWPKAEEAYRKALTLIASPTQMDNRVADISIKLGNVLLKKKELKNAESEFRRALSIYQWNFGPDDIKVADSLDRVTASLHNQENGYALTGPLYSRALAIREKALGPDHPEVADSLDRTGLALYFENGQLSGAIPLFERALKIREKCFGHFHASVANSLSTLAFVYDLFNAQDRAIPLYEEALLIREKILASDDQEILQSLYNLGMAYRLEKSYDKSASIFERRLRILETKFGPNHSEVVSTLSHLDSVLREAGRNEEAKQISERAAQLRSQIKPQEPPKN